MKRPSIFDECDKEHRENLVDLIGIYTEQLGLMRKIAANETYNHSLRDKAEALIPSILDEMRYTKEELEYERRLKELEAE